MENLEIKSIISSGDNKKKLLILFSAFFTVLLLILGILLFLTYQNQQDLVKNQIQISVETEGPMNIKTDLKIGEKITVYQGKVIEIDKETRTIKIEEGGKITELNLPIRARLIRTKKEIEDIKDLATNLSDSGVLSMEEILSQPDLRKGVEISFTSGPSIPVPSLTIFVE